MVPLNGSSRPIGRSVTKDLEWVRRVEEELLSSSDLFLLFRDIREQAAQKVEATARRKEVMVRGEVLIGL